jgi:hypothetical protein
MDINIGADIVLPVDFTALPVNAANHVVYIGLRNILMDSHASVVRKDFATDAEWIAAKRAVAEKKFAAMLAGDIRQTTTKGRIADPVKREAVRMATETIMVAAKKAGEKPDAKTVHARALALIAKNGAYMHLAAKHIEEAAALGVVEDESDIDETLESADAASEPVDVESPAVE